MQKLLFLDVDGVLHRLNGRTFERLQVLVNWLRLHPEVGLILSSSTREHGGAKRLSAALPADVRIRLIGQTPLLRHELGSLPIKHIRQQEILQWLESSGVADVQFAVLDDDHGLFEPGWPPLVLCNPLVALKTRNLKSVEAKLQVYEGNAAETHNTYLRGLDVHEPQLGESKNPG
jgi:hypothetical protein